MLQIVNVLANYKDNAIILNYIFNQSVINKFIFQTYKSDLLSTQCAAVRTCLSVINVPAQSHFGSLGVRVLRYPRATIHGNSPSVTQK